MEIQVQIDEELIRHDLSRGAQPHFEIYWWHADTAYPAPDWTDFGVVIMGWWVLAAQRLLRGSSEERFLFMDGPYELKAKRRDGQILVIGRDPDVEWEISMKALGDALLRAADIIGREFRRLELDTPELGGLQREARALKTSLDVF